MADIRFEYTEEYEPSRVSRWVHHRVGDGIWDAADSYEPPLPGPVPGKGWCRCLVETPDAELVFSSLAELEHVIDILGRQRMPTAAELCRDHPAGPNAHWLSRFPIKRMDWTHRQRLVSLLERALTGYKNEITS